MFKQHVNKDYNLVVIKCKLKTIVRRPFWHLVKGWMDEKSRSATKICALGSLLFLNRVQAVFDNRLNNGIDSDFFGEDGEQIIRSCFYSVTYNKRKPLVIPEEFRAMTGGLEGDDYNPIEWPNNDYFANIMNVLINTYCTNVTTNLNTHLKKRLREYLRMRVYLLNVAANNNVYDDTDISNTIGLAMGEEDRVTDADRQAKRRNLMGMIVGCSWYEILNDNVMEFTKKHWFMSLPMWLTMQREIAEFNTNAGYREERRQNRQEWRKQRREQQKSKQKKDPKSDDNNNNNKPPFITNLAVIPICSWQRTHVMFSNKELHSMMCETGCIPKGEDGKQISCREVIELKAHYWNQIFDLRKIFRLGKRKKTFHHGILTDGVSVSILFEKGKVDDEALMSKEEIIRKYLNGEFIYELGIDPGMKTWNASVRRTIATGKEVCRTKELLFFYCDDKQTQRHLY